MYPKKTASRIPLLKLIALSKPLGGASVMRFASDVVIYPWIWCG